MACANNTNNNVRASSPDYVSENDDDEVRIQFNRDLEPPRQEGNGIEG